MYSMEYRKYLLKYDKIENKVENELTDISIINDYEEIINKLLEFSISGVESIDNIDDIDIENKLYHFYSSEWLNIKELNYDNCIWWYVRDENNNIYKEVFSFKYDEEV